MKEIITLLLIGIALSLDAFSIALSLGLISNNKYINVFPITVGILHFIMPLFGNHIGVFLKMMLDFNYNIILGSILIILSFQMCYEYLKHEELFIKKGIVPILLLAISVSIDSFSTGIGINAITSNYMTSYTIFAICSFTFTICGIKFGKILQQKIGNSSKILGSLILFVIGIVHLCK